MYVFSKKLNITAVESRIVDIDGEVKDPLLCPDIADDIFHNMQLVEQSRSSPQKNYLEKAREDINPEKRACFIEAIFDGADQIHASEETLHLAVNYFDRYLSSRNMIDDNHHLYYVSMTCLVIALKYEEIEEASFNFNLVTCIGLSPDFVRLELSILSCLEYDLAGPTACTFLGRYVRAAYLGGNKSTSDKLEKFYYSIDDLEYVSGNLAKISLMSYRMVGHKPSLVAASSVFLAKYILNPWERPWNRTVQHYTGYEPSDLKECVLELAEARDLYGYVAYAIPTSQPPPIPSHFFTNFG